MDAADVETVIAKRLEWERSQRGLLLGKHRGHDLPFPIRVTERMRQDAIIRKPEILGEADLAQRAAKTNHTPITDGSLH